MSTELRTGISPAFSDAVVAELRAAINNNAPINETVYSSLLPSQKLLGHSSPSARVCMSAQMRLEPRGNTGS